MSSIDNALTDPIFTSSVMQLAPITPFYRFAEIVIALLMLYMYCVIVIADADSSFRG